MAVRFSGRTFTEQEVELMRLVAHDYAGLGVTEIAQTVCELLGWKRPNGGLKNHECRQLMERLATDGLLRLPAVRKLGGTGPRRVDVSRPRGEPPLLECAVSACEPLELALVAGHRESRLWREQVERYHYLGCPVPFGAHLRYWVRNRQRELACLLWTSPAWKMKPRDLWIGWGDEQRQRNLQRIVNNGRFLILPWVRIKGLASKNSGPECPAHAAGLAESLRRPSPAAGNPGRRPSFSRNLLSSGQLDLRGTNHRSRSHGPGTQGGRSSHQGHLSLPGGP